MRYEPPIALLGSMDFNCLNRPDAFIWKGPPMLLYLGGGQLMNKTTNETVTLKATSDDEFWLELRVHGWAPKPPIIELRKDRVGFDSLEHAARIAKVQQAVESLMSKNPFRKS